MASRVKSLADSSDSIDSILYAGEGEYVWFYLVIQVREHEGNQYLNERYAALAKPDTGDDFTDTFRKNGINRRVGDVGTRAKQLAMAYMRSANTRQSGEEPQDTAVYAGPTPDAFEVVDDE